MSVRREALVNMLVRNHDMRWHQRACILVLTVTWLFESGPSALFLSGVARPLPQLLNALGVIERAGMRQRFHHRHIQT
jgi:hypothetical protein